MTDEQIKSLEQLRETCRSMDTALGNAKTAVGILGGEETDPAVLRRAWGAFYNARALLAGPLLLNALVDYERALSPHTLSREDLVFAATMKCPCGAPLAHVRLNHRLHKPEWRCSRSLLNESACSHRPTIGFDVLEIRPAVGIQAVGIKAAAS